MAKGCQAVMLKRMLARRPQLARLIQGQLSKRSAKLKFAILLAAAVLIVGIQSRALVAGRRLRAVNVAVAASKNVDNDTAPVSILSHDGSQVMYRYFNGYVSIVTANLSNLLQSDHRLYGMSLESLESQIEQLLGQPTADCSTYRKLGRRLLIRSLTGRAGVPGHGLCLAGPFRPSQLCYGFSFVSNSTLGLGFEDDLSTSQGCFVLAFDPSTQQASHMHSEHVLLLREGLSGAPAGGQVRMDTYMGYLKRFKADRTVIDVLKIDIRPGDWSFLRVIASDGSLSLTKQLVLNIPTRQRALSPTADQLRSSVLALISLHSAGFRLWNSNSATGEQLSGASLSYININFIHRSKIIRKARCGPIELPVRELRISRSPGFAQLSAMRRANLSAMSPAELDNMYFQLVEQQHLFCPYSRRVGSADDGGWDLCFSEPFSIQSSLGGCVAFSFGINYIWQYDDELADKYRCRVHMFDPSMTELKDHKRKQTSWFYLIGLSSSNQTTKAGWRMRSLCHLFQEIEPGDRTIDILKIDIEYSEWAALEQALKDGCLKRVKQLMFETHTDAFLRKKSNYGRFIRILLGLFDLGFRTWKWHKNPYSLLENSDSGLMRSCCYEHYMLNINFISLN